MNTSKLALLGGNKTISRSFKRYNPIGPEELEAAKAVIESGVLSRFLGVWHEDFYGGPKVREFEAAACEYFGVEHAVTINSWTSGLVVAIGAIGIEPGDEVIVTPWTMSATASAILHWNAIPVFADIDPQSYNLCPVAIEKCISPYTKAIVVADIFGQSADISEIMTLAKQYGLKVISDTAQAPGALYENSFAGTLADIGGYSLNYHKHIHTGEGGILVTNNPEFAERMQLIRNHAEAVVEKMGVQNLANMIGHNFRLGEIECAIGIEQLKKLKNRTASRQSIAQRLNEGLSELNGLLIPKVGSHRTHVYYVYALQLEARNIGVSRDIICQALNAEGVNVSNRYQNIHLLPAYQRKIAFGSNGFPWTSDICKREISYKKGICPVAERLNDESYLGLGLCSFDFESPDVDLVVQAFHKVWHNLDDLRAISEHSV